MTPMQKFIEYLGPEIVKNHNTEYFLEMEKECIKKAIIHSLDEDGHTGDWKIKFAEEYYKKIQNG